MILTTSFGLLLAGTTPAKHRQRDRESINDLWCSSLVPSDQKLPRTSEWTPGSCCRALSSSSSNSLLLSLSEQYTAPGLLANLSDLLPLCCIPLHLALSPVLLEDRLTDAAAACRLLVPATGLHNQPSDTTPPPHPL